jgi:septation ring formation regulator EzrA
MREQIEERLRTLREEFRAGQIMLVDLETQQTNLRTTLARISGAIQVLEEVLSEESQARETVVRDRPEMRIATAE